MHFHSALDCVALLLSTAAPPSIFLESFIIELYPHFTQFYYHYSSSSQYSGPTTPVVQSSSLLSQGLAGSCHYQVLVREPYRVWHFISPSCRRPRRTLGKPPQQCCHCGRRRTLSAVPALQRAPSSIRTRGNPPRSTKQQSHRVHHSAVRSPIALQGAVHCGGLQILFT